MMNNTWLGTGIGQVAIDQALKITQVQMDMLRKIRSDTCIYGISFQKDGKRIDPFTVFIRPHRASKGWRRHVRRMKAVNRRAA